MDGPNKREKEEEENGKRIRTMERELYAAFPPKGKLPDCNAMNRKDEPY